MSCTACGLTIPLGAAACPCGTAVAVVPQAIQDEPVHALRFHGTGGSLFGMVIKNLCLTVLTLGIYYFWGKTAVRKYMHSQLEFHGDRFEYHGTGRELFVARLKAMVIFGVIVLAPNVAARLVHNVPLALGLMLLSYVLLLPLLPIAVVGALRYRLSHTSLHGIRFSFRGRAWDLVKIVVPNLLLTGLTLGFFAPVAWVRTVRFLLNNVYYGNRPLQFHGTAKQIYGRFLRGMLLTIVTFGLYGSWQRAMLDRFMWDNTTFGPARFKSTTTGGGLFVMNLVNMALLVGTLGFAAPWTAVIVARFRADNLALVGELDLASIKQEAQNSSALGDVLADSLDLGLGV